MRILVAHASKHGATSAIAERIGVICSRAGHDVTVRSVTDADPAGFDAFVVGSAMYLGHWLKSATAFIRQHQETLADRPVWLFSSGPIGEAKVDQEGTDLREVTAPQELPDLLASVQPREHRVFFGSLDPKHLTLPERALRKLPAGRDAAPRRRLPRLGRHRPLGRSPRGRAAGARAGTRVSRNEPPVPGAAWPGDPEGAIGR